MSGFQKVNRENINVVSGQTISADAQLQLASLSESVTVTGASPVVDVTTTKVGTDLKGEALTAVPNSTDAWGALSEAPGVRMQGFDVGGSHKSQQSGYEVFGIQNQSRIVTDGVDHTEGVGGTGYYEDYYSNEEVSISALGSDVEMNSGGAAVITTIKSGGNQFKGLENFTYENGSWVGDNNTDALRAKGFTGNPNLLFYEGHADLGGPIMRDKAWFFAAYNTFKIDKVVSGVPQNIATDIGLFHNYTGKGTWKPSAADTVIGYIQRGHKEKPKRSLSALIPPESVLAQDSITYTYKGEWQRVFSNRTFFDVTVGNYHSIWPMVPQVAPATHIPTYQPGNGRTLGRRLERVHLDPEQPAGEGAVDLLPAGEERQPRLQVRLRVPPRLLPARHQRPVGSVSPLVQRRGRRRPDPVRRRRCGLRLRHRLDGRAQRRSEIRGVRPGSLGAEQPADDHGRRSASTIRTTNYGDSVRKPVITDLLPDGTRIFPTSTTVTGASLLVKTNAAARLGFSYDLTGKGQTVLKGFYGRYYNNLADGFYNANPGGTSYAEYNFNDLNHNGQVRRTIGARWPETSYRRRRRSSRPEREDALHRGVQRLGRAPVLGRVVGSRLTYVRKHSADFIPFYYNPYVPAWDGKLTVPTRQVSSDGQVFNLVDVPNSLASQSSTDSTPTSRTATSTTTRSKWRSTSASAQKFFIQTSADYQWRNELRSADIPDWGSTSPLSTDPIGVNYFVNANPSGRTARRRRRITSSCWDGTRSRTRSASP